MSSFIRVRSPSERPTNALIEPRILLRCLGASNFSFTVARTDINVGKNRVAVSRILRTAAFNSGHEAKNGNILRTYFPSVVVRFTSGTMRFPNAVRDIGYRLEKWSAFNPALPNFIYCQLGYRNRVPFMGKSP
jgi:hypothetical protein